MADKIITAAEEFFTKLEAMTEPQRYAHIMDMVAKHEPESDWLEFKEVRQVLDKLNPEWSKSLSAMANTSGGIIIWGIHTERSDGRDCADSANPVREPVKLQSHLEECRPNATVQPVQGVRYRVLANAAANDGSGFLVTYIPNSDHKPHQAAQHHSTYFMRIGTKSKAIPHELLRSMFFPKAIPEFRIIARVK